MLLRVTWSPWVNFFIFKAKVKSKNMGTKKYEAKLGRVPGEVGEGVLKDKVGWQMIVAVSLYHGNIIVPDCTDKEKKEKFANTVSPSEFKYLLEFYFLH